MCDPMTMLSFGLKAMSAVGEHQAQQHEAEQQEAQNKVNTKSAIRSFEDQTRGLNERLSQESAAAVDERLESALEAARIKSRMLASAGEAGVSGLGVDHLVRDVGRTESRNMQQINRNERNVYSAAMFDKKGYKSQAQSRINNLPQPQYPSMLATGLKIAGAGLDSYGSYKSSLPKSEQDKLWL